MCLFFILHWIESFVAKRTITISYVKSVFGNPVDSKELDQILEISHIIEILKTKETCAYFKRIYNLV